MYEVLALKYGERDTTKCQFFYRESSHDKLTLDYFVWLILGGPQPLLVDTGFRDDDARARGIRNYVSPAAMVERARGQGRPTCRSRSSPICTTTTGPATACSRTRSSGSRARKSRSGPDRSAARPAFRGSANVDALARLVTLNYANKIRIVEGDHEVWPGIRVHRSAATPPGSRSSPSRPGAARSCSRPTPRTSTTTWRPGSRSRSSRACPRCSRPSRRSTGSRARRSSIVAGHDPQVSDRFKRGRARHHQDRVKEPPMRPIVIGIALTVALGLSTAAAQSPSWRPPTENQRCPRSGARATSAAPGNHMKPASVLKAARLIQHRRGDRARPGAQLVACRFPPRASFNVHTKRTFMNTAVQPSRQQRGSSSPARIGQVGTQSRRLRPPDASRTGSTTASSRRDRDAHRLHQVRHRERAGRWITPRRADRRRRAEGCRHAGRYTTRSRWPTSSRRSSSRTRSCSPATR